MLSTQPALYSLARMHPLFCTSQRIVFKSTWLGNRAEFHSGMFFPDDCNVKIAAILYERDGTKDSRL